MCDPVASEDTVSRAADPAMVPEPSEVEPSRKVTEPVGEVPPLSEATRVTEEPELIDVEDALKVTVGASCVMVTVAELDVADALLASPP